MVQGAAVAGRAMTGAMPPESPLPHPRQDFAEAFRDGAAPAEGTGDGNVTLWRLAVFLPAVAAAAAVLWIAPSLFAPGGARGAEIAISMLIALGFFPIALAVCTALGGAVSMLRRPAPRRAAAPARGLDVALLVPVHGEAAAAVFGRAAAMLEALRRRSGPHRFALYVLSDTPEGAAADAERAAFAALRAGGLGPVWYRRRARNVDRKVGNLADWLVRWGGAHDAMVVLDADSLMGPRALRDLADALAADPAAGLIQSCPRILGARTLFARSQQFAGAVHGRALAEGLARWAGAEGTYWGHNAIVRTHAFARSAGLPHLGGALILSHDVVEAGLLRRAGWAVRVLPRVAESFEETPPTLVDHCLRDRRWCRGNMQHLRLVHARGFRTATRVHLLQGAMGYLLSPLWLALLLLWTVSGAAAPAAGGHLALMTAVYALLAAPRLIGATALLLSGTPMRRLGGAWRFAGSLLAEAGLSMLFAPILMVQHTEAVARAALGRRQDWQPSSGARRSLGALLRFHRAETVLGAAALAGIAAGAVSPWLLPVAVPLALAVPLSALSGMVWPPAVLRTPQDLHVPPIAVRAAWWGEALRVPAASEAAA
ncbi:glucans biosynthesis glucosyltransferase MdoH [Jannaschia sp. W003]|uniref:glucans biosynthesis glucosyltransferase MdoH n=1 Tax=Jannaschia sp. W003 TaxID=2867012 RepID=UPI0021A6AB88|nr:glucans biosynthesis glucosyltransferase MdoH [Jannaschia sp. W003]UWQ20523.1 glucans biosynthesis glucosyltransferase MdoH [Jannaschia sp. W003]